MSRSRSVSQAIGFASLTLAFFGVALANEPQPEYDEFNASIIRVDTGTFETWAADFDTEPTAPIVQRAPLFFEPTGKGAFEMKSQTKHFDLLNYLSYTTEERDQGACGNCWAWAGTGAMEIALNVALNAQGKDARRLSTQFFNSCRTTCSNPPCLPCCGGSLHQFAKWYQGEGEAISWSAGDDNTAFHDAHTACVLGDPASYISAWDCDRVRTSPGAIHYNIDTIEANRIETDTPDQERAIENIKNVLEQQKKGVIFTMWWTNPDDDMEFQRFWETGDEQDLWDWGNADCNAVGLRGAHAHTVLIVGYDETSDEPYWIALNSQGHGERRVLDHQNRPTWNRANGLFRIKMNMNYNCMALIPDPQAQATKVRPLRWFEALNIKYHDLHPGKNFPTYGASRK